LLRYSRHILLDELGVEGQQRFAKAHALVVGVGGLGSPLLCTSARLASGASRWSTTTPSI
jgi:molybdopterin/thiamine biosynthesis adenylyltransferase